MQERDNGLVCGVEVLPGSPEPVAVRRVQTVTNAAINDPFSPAFLLPEVQAMSSPASLVIPAGWYQAGRMLEMHTTTNWQVRLTGVFQRGSDFDRVGFVMAG
jgi:cyclic-di-GMP-binding protein